MKAYKREIETALSFVCWTSPFVILVVSGFLSLLYYLMEILLAYNADPDQTPHHMASDLSLHCLLMTFTDFQVIMG